MLINIEWGDVFKAEAILIEEERITFNVFRQAVMKYHDQLERKLRDWYVQHLETFHDMPEPKQTSYCPYCGARKE